MIKDRDYWKDRCITLYETVKEDYVHPLDGRLQPVVEHMLKDWDNIAGMNKSMEHIVMNTINKPDSVYKDGILTSIKAAVSKYNFEHWCAYYEN